MQRTQADSFTQLKTCVGLIKNTALIIKSLNAIPETDFTFGRVETYTDKVLWHFSRYITGTMFINESYAKTQSFLEGIFGKDDIVNVPSAMTVYCEPFIENHQDLGLVQKRELQRFCIKQTKEKIFSDRQYVQGNLPTFLKETFPFFQKIQAEQLIEFEEMELACLKDFLGEEIKAQSWERCCESLVEMVNGSFFGKVDILMVIVQKIIKHLEPELEEWTKV